MKNCIKRVGIVVATAALLVAGSPAVVAQQDTDDLPRLVEEMSGVNRSLDQLVRLMESILEQQKTDLLLKRIEMKERRVSPLEAEMRNARNTASGISTEIERLQAMLDEWESAHRRAVRDGKEAVAAEQLEMINQVRSNLEIEILSRDDFERRARDLEDEIALHRRVIEVLDDMLAEKLGE